MDEEIASQVANGTHRWELLADQPKGTQVVKTKWVFKYKLNPDGTIARRKARWVVCGYNMYANETFSSMAKHKSLAVLFAVHTTGLRYRDHRCPT